MQVARKEICLVAVLATLAFGCVPDPITKDEARATGGRGSDGEDLCNTQRWYGDGECDAFCPLLDPDCRSSDGGVRDGGAVADAGRDAGPVAFDAGDAPDAGAALDAGAADTGASLMDAGADGGSPGPDAGAPDAGARDAGAGVDAGPGPPNLGTFECVPAGTPGPPGPAVPLVGGFDTGRCDHSAVAWEDNVLRGPALYSWSRPASSPQQWRTFPVELEAGQTLSVRATSSPSDTFSAGFSGGPCKNPGSSPVPITVTVSAGISGYLRLHAVGSGAATIEVEISGAPGAGLCTRCNPGRAVEVDRDRPFVFGSALPGTTETLAMWSDISAPGSVSCTGLRHSGRDALFRVTLRSGESLSASANNYASLGPDPCAFYLVRDCDDLSDCVAAGHGYAGCALSHTAAADETLYLVLDHFGSSDYTPTAVRIAVTPP